MIGIGAAVATTTINMHVRVHDDVWLMGFVRSGTGDTMAVIADSEGRLHEAKLHQIRVGTPASMGAKT